MSTPLSKGVALFWKVVYNDFKAAQMLETASTS